MNNGMTPVSELELPDDAIEGFTALDLKSIALLLDVDGTIIDIGPTPHEVHVPDALCKSLARLDERLGGACALVSGRLIADLDRLFSPLKLSTVGAHGAEMRVAGAGVAGAVTVLPTELRRRLAGAAAPGVIIEDKGYSLTLHFRAAPEREGALRALAVAVCKEFAGEGIDILPGKAMIEIKRVQVNKGEGVRALMQLPPFAGRKPVFIGDDVTDESVFAALPQIGGVGFSVGRKFSGLAGAFHTPAQVRIALQTLARQGEGRPR